MTIPLKCDVIIKKLTWPRLLVWYILKVVTYFHIHTFIYSFPLSGYLMLKKSRVVGINKKRINRNISCLLKSSGSVILFVNKINTSLFARSRTMYNPQ